MRRKRHTEDMFITEGWHSKVGILKVLKAHPEGLGITHIKRATGMSINLVYKHIDGRWTQTEKRSERVRETWKRISLIELGYVKKGPGRFDRYKITPEGEKLALMVEASERKFRERCLKELWNNQYVGGSQ